MLGLREQVGRDPRRIVGAVRHHENLGRSRDGIDPHPAEHFALGGGDIGVARPDDLVDRRNRCGPIGQRGNGLRAAHAIDFRDACELRRGQRQRIDFAPVAGVTMTIRATPATRAGTAFIRTELGYDAVPPGT